MLNYHPRNARMRFLEESLSLDTDDCIEWPFSCAGGNGGRSYGSVTYEGRHTYAHRVVCRIVHGDRSGMQAAHFCGNSRCINKRHIRWATPKENAADKIEHGTNNDGERHGLSVLTNEQAEAIRTLAKSGVKQRRLCEQFSASPMTISRLARGLSYRRAA